MIQGALLIALAALLWATTGIVAKFLFTGTELQAITLGFLRLAVALPFFWLLMRREQARLERANPGAKVPGSSLRSLTRQTLIPLAALGLFQAFYQGSYLLAVDLTGAGIATLIALCLPPVLVAILAAPLLGEKPSLLTVLSLFAAIAGPGRIPGRLQARIVDTGKQITGLHLLPELHRLLLEGATDLEGQCRSLGSTNNSGKPQRHILALAAGNFRHTH